MESARYEHFQALSTELTGNSTVVAVACAILSLPASDGVTAPRLMEALGGRCAQNRVADALQRLTRLGALVELPYPGRPHARAFERLDSPFWSFIQAWALDSV